MTMAPPASGRNASLAPQGGVPLYVLQVQGQEEEHRYHRAELQQRRHVGRANTGQQPAEQQEAGERQRVAGGHPLQVLLAEAQGALDGRQRDIDDRGVEHDEKLRAAEQQQNQQAAAGQPRAGGRRARDGSGDRSHRLPPSDA